MANKTNLKIWWVISVVLTSVLSGSVWATGTYDDGDGSEGNPFQINTAAQMDEIGQHSEDWTSYFILTADIDLAGYTGTAFNIIGNSSTKFTGFFDGDGHIISNFTYTSTGTNYVGLFGYVGSVDGGGEIKDLGLTNVNVDGGTGDFVGGLVGFKYYGTVSNCQAAGTVTATGGYVGGLVGRNYGIISNCYATGSVSGDDWVGGLVGWNYHGTVSNCYATASVSGDDWVGGLMGVSEGGIVSSIISNCYATGAVTGTTNVGGLVGWAYGTVFNSFWDIETSGQSTSAGGTGKTTAEMQDPNTYIGWGCEGVWTIDAGVDYPRLIWENAPGDLIDAQLSDFVTGAGTETEPYLIYTAEQLNLIGLFVCDWDKDFKLMADIDLSAYTGTSFNMIGIYTYGGAPGNKPFTGSFDGNGHTISNFTYSSTDVNYYIGLFRYVGVGCEIKDLGLINANVDVGTGAVGSLVGYLEAGAITNCYVEGGSVTGTTNVGGLVGGNWGEELEAGTITNCYSTASVSGDDYVGGLVGWNYKGAISNCYSTGSVSGDYDVGGLVGRNEGLEVGISSSYCTGDVSGNENVGGLVGVNCYGTVSNCYATGSVSGSSSVGGLVGLNHYEGVSMVTRGTVFKSFWDIQTSGLSTSAGGTGKTTAQMKDPNTYIGWGCEPVWTIDAGVDYPHLVWENMPGEIIIDPPKFYGGGSGTENDPYLIFTAEQLNTLGSPACDWDMHFKLMADIDLSAYTGTAFNIIGNKAIEFTGVFDGNGHTISNFTYTSTDTDAIGLFSYVGTGGEIKDLALQNVNVDGGTGWRVGGLAGIAYGTIANCWIDGGTVSGDGGVGGLVGYNYGTISDCRVDGGTVSGSGDRGNCIGGLVGINSGLTTKSSASAGVVANGLDSRYIGGLVGRNEGEGTINNCYSTGSVSGSVSFKEAGGLVGAGYAISNCYATGNVSGGDYRIGGLVGSGGAISNCYATGNVSSSSGSAGGLVGCGSIAIADSYSTGSVTGDWAVGGLLGQSYANITNCYSAGSVSGTTDVGGLVGYRWAGSATNSFWDIETSGQATSDGGMGLTTALMQMTFVFTLAGWDFVGETVNGPNDIWTIHEGVDYPKQVWELVNFIGWYEVDLLDFAFFADRWADTNCGNANDCDGADLDFSGAVDGKDLKIFCDNWLLGVQ